MKLSIIIPAYKAQKSIGRCLESIFAGDHGFPDYEVIVVSDDETNQDWNELNQAIDTTIINYTQPVKCIHNSRAKGVSGARNTGLDVATGEYVWFVDSDDTVSEEWYTVIENVGVSDVLIFGYKTLRNGRCGQLFQTEIDGFFNTSEFVSCYLQPLQIQWLLNSSCNKVFRLETLGDVRFREGYSMGEDLYFVLSALKVSKSISLSSKILYNYHLGENEYSLCKDFHADAIDMTFMTWKLERELLDKYGVRMESKVKDFYAENKLAYQNDLITEHGGRLRDLTRIEAKACDMQFPNAIKCKRGIVSLYMHLRYIRMRKILSVLKHSGIRCKF